MFNLSNNSTTKYHRFQYHPRNYDEKKQDIALKKKRLEHFKEDPDFDVLEYHRSKKTKPAIRTDLIVLGAVFFITILLAEPINNYLSAKYKYGGFGIYFLLILQGFIFTKRSKK